MQQLKVLHQHLDWFKLSADARCGNAPPDVGKQLLPSGDLSLLQCFFGVNVSYFTGSNQFPEVCRRSKSLAASSTALEQRFAEGSRTWFWERTDNVWSHVRHDGQLLLELARIVARLRYQTEVRDRVKTTGSNAEATWLQVRLE